ncbi:MAG: biotin transporter BioY [Dehalococcoidia bacterium]|nr:biotin transporter BioY [Dehalococcoidia bacterium]
MQGTPSRATSIAGALIPRSSTWVNVAVDAVLIVGFAALTGLAAQIKIYLNPAVPITGQSFAVLLAGAALGSKRGGASMLVYLMAGIAGIPVFASGGVSPGSSRGYILGFVAAAALVGYLCERGWGRNPLKLIAAMLAGEAAIYVFGLWWLAFYFTPAQLAASVSAGKLSAATHLAVVWEWGVKDFIIGDTIKLLMAAFGVPLAWVGIRKLKGQDV